MVKIAVSSAKPGFVGQSHFPDARFSIVKRGFTIDKYTIEKERIRGNVPFFANHPRC